MSGRVMLAVEGETDIAVAQKMLEPSGLCGLRMLAGKGKDYLDGRIPGLNKTGGSWLILRDLDRDGPCAPDLRRRLLKNESMARKVNVRIAVRAIESWLLADHEGFAQEFAVSGGRLPKHPDRLDDPKGELVRICRGTRKPRIREAMVPRDGSRRKVGPGYGNSIIRFSRNRWQPARAASRSPSLRRALESIRAMKAGNRWP